MLDADENNNSDTSPANTGEAAAPEAGTEAPVKKAARKAPAKKAAAKKAPAKKAAKKVAASAPESTPENTSANASESGPQNAGEATEVTAEKPKKKTSRKTAAAKAAPESSAETSTDAGAERSESAGAQAPAAPMVLFQPPEKTAAPSRKRAAKATAKSEPASADGDVRSDARSDTASNAVSDTGSDTGSDTASDAGSDTGETPAPAKKTARKRAKKAAKAPAAETEPQEAEDSAAPGEDDDADGGEGGPRRRRRRGGRRRRKAAGEDGAEGADESDQQATDNEDDETEGDEGGTRRRRTRVRKPRNPEDEITSVSGSTRLEAKKQRRREGREAGRRRAPIVSEAEFLARREAVDRVMVIRQRDDLTQIAVLEDKVLVEHYVARESQTSLIGNIYLGRVQNVLPSMEAAFVDIGKGRNAVLYAGEVNWSALGHKDGQPRKVESVLKSGQTILVQVTKDPVGHKGARLTGQISLPGRFLVYVPDGNTSGISRKLPDTERNRLKSLLKDIVPDTAGVIVRTAAEGASEDELTQDVERLTARWADIEKKVQAGNGPELLYGEPDLTLKVVRDLFTEDFSRLVIQGDDAWDLVDGYVSHVAPDLRDRLERFESQNGKDVFAAHRVDEQIAKGLDRKVWLPSGGSLVIDRTEAMTVVDVNTGKFTGSGGNLEETVTKNNLEAAEEIVRQLRLRDIGGIIVVDFIDMVLESNRDLVLRRLVECLGRDRTRHQVAEVTSLGLVQMTRKRIGTGLLEAFSEECEHCKGRGVILHERPIELGGRAAVPSADEGRGRRGRGGRGRSRTDAAPEPVVPSPMALAGTKPHTELETADIEPFETVAARPPQEPPFETVAARPPQEPPFETVAARPPQEQPTEATQIEPVETPAAERALMGTAPADADESPSEGVEVTWAAVAPTGPLPDQEPSSNGATTDGSTTEPEDTPVEPPAAPIMVTSTRRRRAGRPAGPPVSTSVAQEPEAQADASTPAGGDDDLDTAAVDPQGVDSQAEDEAGGPPLVHVPVKKKGSRKR